MPPLSYPTHNGGDSMILLALHGPDGQTEYCSLTHDHAWDTALRARPEGQSVCLDLAGGRTIHLEPMASRRLALKILAAASAAKPLGDDVESLIDGILEDLAELIGMYPQRTPPLPSL